MKTPLGEIDDSWSTIIDTPTSRLMLETIKGVCQIESGDTMLPFKKVGLDKLKAVVILDSSWGPFDDPVRYDKSFPPEAVERIAKILGRYPDTDGWSKQGVLGITYPMTYPLEDDRRKYVAVWEGWTRNLLKGLSSRKKTHKYAFLLMGRNSQRLLNSITLTMPVIITCDPSTWGYEKENTCGFTELNKKAKMELRW